jgi:hypothetical protein
MKFTQTETKTKLTFFKLAIQKENILFHDNHLHSPF